MKNYVKFSALLLSLSLCVSGCAGNTGSTPETPSVSQTTVETVSTETSTETSTEASTSTEAPVESTSVSASAEENVSEMSKEEELAAKRYAYLLDSALQSTGNNYRLKKVIEKARSGETVNIAALGGSITEGAGANSFHEGYAYLFANAFKETYCSGDNLNYVNAGLSGTPSALGVMRYEKDVVEQLGCAPDLLIIEFAVNDYNETTNGRALESLIYQALTDNEECAVILLFSVSEGKWSMASEMQVTGRYYSVPMVNMKSCLATGFVSDSDYFYDEYHPAPYGHQLTCDCLMYLLSVVDAKEIQEPADIPADARLGRDFTNMKLALPDSSDVKITLGSFDSVDKEVQNCAFKNTLSFPDNYMHKSDSGSKSLKFVITASHVMINYKTASSAAYGEADIYVDGKKVTTVNGYSAGGWNNCNALLILDEKEAKQHTIEIKMSKGQENKKFTLMALAYN